MSQATLLVFFAVALSVFLTSDAVDRQHKGDTHIGVSPRSFQQLSEQSASVLDSESVAVDDATVSSGARHAQIANDLSQSLEEVVQENLLKDKVRSLAHLKAGNAESMTRESSAGLHNLGQSSKALRSAVQKLGLDLGLDSAAAKADLKSATVEQHQVHSRAEQLDRRLDEIEAAAAAPIHHSSTKSAKEALEDKQFHELEAQTKHMVEWFNQLKKLRDDRDKMKHRRNQALHAAESLGISREEINKQIAAQGAHAASKTTDVN